ncbi:MAG: hypothetical protein FJY11_05815, partial [Bacteroidetes bacterium]|nr:hypothetical protein [Bacteroidota bacterium]
MKNLCTATLALLLTFTATAQINEEDVRRGLASITENVLKAQLTFLASDWMEGRETGEKGEYMSADYIASMLQLFGAVPAGDYGAGVAPNNPPGASRQRTYFQNFQLLKSMPGNLQTMSVVTTSGSSTEATHFTYNVDYSFRNTTAGIELDAPVVFVGYGIRTDKHNDFNKKEVKGKVILRVAGLPPSMRGLGQAETSAANASKDAAARELGAVAVLEVNPSSIVLSTGAEPRDFFNMSPAEGRPRTGRPSASLSIPQASLNIQIPRVSVTTRLANEILDGSGLTITDFASGNPGKSPLQYPDIQGKRIRLVSTVNTSLINVRNVLGMIEGVNREEIIV